MLTSASLLVLALAGAAQSRNITHTYGKSKVPWSTCGKLGNKTLECARLSVPMDHWAKQPTNKTFSISLMRMLADDPAAKTVLINPGGPGASGIDFLQSYGPALDKVMDGHFHLLGFDPRGIAASTPTAKCMPDDAQLFASEKIPLGPLIPSEDYTLTVKANSGDFYAALTNYAKLCNETIGEHVSYMNTPQTAADMKDILDTIDEEMLNFYGGSYGTLLGTVFAQLYPHRVGKMALDGLVDHVEYWDRVTAADTSSLDDCWEGMLNHCINERATCPLADGFANVTELRSALEQKIDAMDIDPVGVYFNYTGYGVFRGSDVRSTGVFSRIYSPSRWPFLMRSLAYLLRDDYATAYLHFFGGQTPASPRDKHDDGVRLQVTGTEADSPDALNIVTLADRTPTDRSMSQRPTRKEVADAFRFSPGYIAKDLGISEIFLAGTWLLPRTHEFMPAKTIETATPVLLLSTKYDPVTPLRSAQAVNKILQGSVLLVQDSIGHTTISKASKCTVGHMRRYFVEGVLPAVNTVCDVDDSTYFPDPDVRVSKIATHTDDFELELALAKLAEYSEKNGARQFATPRS